MSLNLYEIANEYRVIDAAIDAAGGELTPEIERAITELDASLAAKVDGIGVIIAESNARGNAYHDEAERLGERANTAYGKASRLKNYLLTAMKLSGKTYASGSLFSARRAVASRPAIRWAAPDRPIPREFVRIVEQLDSDKALDAYRENRLPDGFTAERKEYVAIR